MSTTDLSTAHFRTPVGSCQTASENFDGARLPAQDSGSKLEVGSRAGWVRTACCSGRWEQAVCFFNSVQTFPCGFGQRRVCTNDIANHLPSGNVKRTLWCGTHGQRDGTLRTETDSLRRRFLTRPYSHGLRKQVDCNRFLSGLELPVAAKTIQVVQSGLRPSKCVHLLSRTLCGRHKYAEGFPQPTRTKLCSSQNGIASRTLLPWALVHLQSCRNGHGFRKGVSRWRPFVTAFASAASNFCWFRLAAGAGFSPKAALSLGSHMRSPLPSRLLKRRAFMAGWRKFRSRVTSGGSLISPMLHRPTGQNFPSARTFAKYFALKRRRNRIEIRLGFRLKKRSNVC